MDPTDSVPIISRSRFTDVARIHGFRVFRVLPGSSEIPGEPGVLSTREVGTVGARNNCPPVSDFRRPRCRFRSDLRNAGNVTRPLMRRG